MPTTMPESTNRCHRCKSPITAGDADLSEKLAKRWDIFTDGHWYCSACRKQILDNHMRAIARKVTPFRYRAIEYTDIQKQEPAVRAARAYAAENTSSWLTLCLGLSNAGIQSCGL